MRQEWIRIFKESAGFAFPESETGRHSINDPSSSLNDPSLRFWQLSVHLVYGLSQFLVRNVVSSKVILGNLNKWIKIAYICKVLTVENTKAFSPIEWFADPVLIFESSVKFKSAKKFLWILKVSGQ